MSFVSNQIDSLHQSDSTTLHAEKEFLSASYLKERRAFWQYWSDQFPSPLIMHFNGLPNKIPDELPIKNKNDEWKFWLSLALLAMLAWIRFGYTKEFDEQLAAFRNWGMNQQLLRELGVGAPFGVVLLNIFSTVVISFYGFLLIEYFGLFHAESSWLMMPATFLAAVVFLVFRYLLLKSVEMVATHGKELRLYIFYELQLNRVIGIFLFPPVILMVFASHPLNLYAMYTSFIVILVLLIMRFVKGFNLGISYFGTHAMHFLLYICALEIAPILIVVRLLSDMNPVRLSF
ncbi:MAG: DUF4271 domain-containing protein [Chitinophagales bacterium]